jgi:GGDEF domain-containing protein
MIEGVEIVLLMTVVAIAVWRPRRLIAVPSLDGRLSPNASPVASIATEAPEDVFTDRAAWADRIRAETSRCARHEQSAAIVIIRLEAFHEVVAASVAKDRRRMCQAVVASLRRSARGFDVVFGDQTGTFRVLLVEADERGARAYVDRVAEGALRPWLETINKDVRLTAVWAATSELTDLPAADRLAESRLTGVEDGWIRSSFVLRA